MGIRHKKTTPIGDGIVDGRVQPTWWNEDHDIGDFLDVLFGLAVTAGTFPYIKSDGTAGLAPLADFPRSLLALPAAPDVLAALAGAPLDSAHLTGAPTAPTAPLGANTAQIATMAALQAMRGDLVGSAPEALNAINELAAALGNDANFATTMATALGSRLRFDAVQSLTSGQKAQAILNLALATVAVTGSYADLTGRPSLATVATSGAYGDLSGRPTLGTAAAINVGTGANQVVQMDAAGKLPPVDGSQLTGVQATVRAGTARLTYQATAETGWILANDGSIGDASSGATTRADADTAALFALLYALPAALVLQDNTGTTVARGASAAADYAAHRRLVIPKMLGRSLGVAGSGSGLTARVLGTTAGAETETPTIAKTAAHDHTKLTTGDTSTGAAGAGFAPVRGGNGGDDGSSRTSSTGSGTPLNIVDPISYLNLEIKL